MASGAPLITWDQGIQILTALVALWGAGLSTYTFVTNRRDKRRVLKVRLRYALVPNIKSEPESRITITVSNPGYHSLTVTSVSFRLPSRKQLVYPYAQSDKSLPHELTPGTQLTVFISARQMVKDLKKGSFSGVVRLVGVCSDALGGEHKSSPYDFDMDANYV